MESIVLCELSIFCLLLTLWHHSMSSWIYFTMLQHQPHVLDFEIYLIIKAVMSCIFVDLSVLQYHLAGVVSLHLVTWISDTFYQQEGNDQNWCQLHGNTLHFAMMITTYYKCIYNLFYYWFIHQDKTTSFYVSACAWSRCYQYWVHWCYRMQWGIGHCYWCILIYHDVQLLTPVFALCHSPLHYSCPSSALYHHLECCQDCLAAHNTNTIQYKLASIVLIPSCSHFKSTVQ